MENSQIVNIDENSANNWMTVAIKAVIPEEGNSQNTLGEETIESESQFTLQTVQNEICGMPISNSGEFVLLNVEKEQFQHCAGNQDEESLRKLLKEFDLEPVFEYLKAAQVTYRSLQFMRKDPLGLRMEFREKLFIWKKKQIYVSKKWGLTKYDRERYEELRNENRLEPAGCNVKYRPQHGPMAVWEKVQREVYA